MAVQQFVDGPPHPVPIDELSKARCRRQVQNACDALVFDVRAKNLREQPILGPGLAKRINFIDVQVVPLNRFCSRQQSIQRRHNEEFTA